MRSEELHVFLKHGYKMVLRKNMNDGLNELLEERWNLLLNQSQ